MQEVINKQTEKILRFLIKESFTIPFASFARNLVTWVANFPRSSLVVFFHDHVTCLWQATLLELHLSVSHKQIFYDHVCGSPPVNDFVEGC